MHRVVTEMHMPEVTICYGMTETSPVSFQSGPDDPPKYSAGCGFCTTLKTSSGIVSSVKTIS